MLGVKSGTAVAKLARTLFLVKATEHVTRWVGLIQPEVGRKYWRPLLDRFRRGRGGVMLRDFTESRMERGKCAVSAEVGCCARIITETVQGHD